MHARASACDHVAEHRIQLQARHVISRRHWSRSHWARPPVSTGNALRRHNVPRFRHRRAVGRRAQVRRGTVVCMQPCLRSLCLHCRRNRRRSAVIWLGVIGISLGQSHAAKQGNEGPPLSNARKLAPRLLPCWWPYSALLCSVPACEPWSTLRVLFVAGGSQPRALHCGRLLLPLVPQARPGPSRPHGSARQPSPTPPPSRPACYPRWPSLPARPTSRRWAQSWEKGPELGPSAACDDPRPRCALRALRAGTPTGRKAGTKAQLCRPTLGLRRSTLPASRPSGLPADPRFPP